MKKHSGERIMPKWFLLWLGVSVVGSTAAGQSLPDYRDKMQSVQLIDPSIQPTSSQFKPPNSFVNRADGRRWHLIDAKGSLESGSYVLQYAPLGQTPSNHTELFILALKDAPRATYPTLRDYLTANKKRIYHQFRSVKLQILVKTPTTLSYRITAKHWKAAPASRDAFLYLGKYLRVNDKLYYAEYSALTSEVPASQVAAGIRMLETMQLIATPSET
jgi:hypothetical protein